MNFFEATGIMAIGSRLRMLSERISEDSQQLYAAYGVALRPKWFPVFYVLSEASEPTSVTQIAEIIGHSHPSVVRIIKEMSAAGLLLDRKDPDDRRRTLLQLSENGQDLAHKIANQYRDVTAAIAKMLEETQHNLWKAMEEIEYLLDDACLYQRVMQQKKLRESSRVQIVTYKPVYRDTFRRLNEEWIIKYFTMEESDRKTLEQPQTYIIEKGGEILVALIDGVPVGVCALIPMPDTKFDYELAKMAVSPHAQGRGIGFMLGNAIKVLARKKGGRTLYLESNTVLGPAIQLYHKLGFEKITGFPSPYNRCNIQMVATL